MSEEIVVDKPMPKTCTIEEAFEIVVNLFRDHKDNHDALLERLESPQFYNLMQVYRMSPVLPQDHVVKAFNDIKAFIRGKP